MLREKEETLRRKMILLMVMVTLLAALSAGQVSAQAVDEGRIYSVDDSFIDDGLAPTFVPFDPENVCYWTQGDEIGPEDCFNALEARAEARAKALKDRAAALQNFIEDRIDGVFTLID